MTIPFSAHTWVVGWFVGCRISAPLTHRTNLPQKANASSIYSCAHSSVQLFSGTAYLNAGYYSLRRSSPATFRMDLIYDFPIFDLENFSNNQPSIPT